MAPVEKRDYQTWVRVGAVASLAAAAVFAAARRRKPAWFFARVAAACAVSWREDSMALEVGNLLAKAGRRT